MPVLETKGSISSQGYGQGLATQATYIEDVFSTWLYNGNGGTQTITNGIDLAGKGGMIWQKRRDSAGINTIFDTSRGANYLSSDQTSAQSSAPDNVATSSGFTFTGNGFINANGGIFATWTFRKQPKFFDIVTYTGNGANRTIAHNLGSVPGCIIVKRTDTTSGWNVYHRSLTSAAFELELNTTSAQFSDTTIWNSTAPTSSVFSVGTNGGVNANGGTYVAYLFAHDAGGFGASGSDNVISCGSFNTDASGNATVNLGYEMQYMLFKTISGAADSWYVADIIRGMSVAVNASILSPNTNTAEQTGFNFSLNATGFSLTGATPSVTYIYIAIRRPMKTPTSGTEVFVPLSNTGTGATKTISSPNFSVDLFISQSRIVASGAFWFQRLIGSTGFVASYTANAQDSLTNVSVKFDSNTGVVLSSDPYNVINGTTSGNTYAEWVFKRAPGFFDIVCYTGTGSTQNVNHNLNVAPELVIIKSRSGAGSGYGWVTGSSMYPSWGRFIPLNTTDAVNVTNNAGPFNNTAPTSSVFTVNTWTETNGLGSTYVAYLFASCPGVSKIGSYTGNGTSQTINCGFTSGARFILIKRTDSTGDWYVWDSARGIVASNDNHLSLNTTAAEVTTDDSVDANASGFIVNQVTATNVNVNSATYIYLAIA